MHFSKSGAHALAVIQDYSGATTSLLQQHFGAGVAMSKLCLNISRLVTNEMQKDGVNREQEYRKSVIVLN